MCIRDRVRMDQFFDGGQVHRHVFDAVVVAADQHCGRREHQKPEDIPVSYTHLFDNPNVQLASEYHRISKTLHCSLRAGLAAIHAEEPYLFRESLSGRRKNYYYSCDGQRAKAWISGTCGVVGSGVDKTLHVVVPSVVIAVIATNATRASNRP